MPEINWIFDLKKTTPLFLNKLKSENRPGFYKYSLTGDLYDENSHWGLGNTVFAIKIYYTLNLLNKLEAADKKNLISFIQSFLKENGIICDPLVKKRAALRNLLSSFKELDFANILGQQTALAETRQVISALKLLNTRPKIIFTGFPKTEKEIDIFLNKLNWKKPWRAGSHFSHLLFFLKNNEEKNSLLIDYTVNWVTKIQNAADGAWYRWQTTIREKINGAMKIITGLKVVNKINFFYPEKLINLCLSAKNNEHACDNFNIIYVLHYAAQLQPDYRKSEIEQFFFDRLDIYRKYYYPNIGGFSFLPNCANIYYYGAKLTKGLNEPDIHGTVMFLWGISIIAQQLRINERLQFNEFIP